MGALIDKKVLTEITRHFQALRSVVPLRPIHSEVEYDQAVSSLNQLLDAGAADEKHALADLVSTLGALIAEYDREHFPRGEVSAVSMLEFLMDQNNLSQSDLPEVGSQGVVSEILSGKRKLNLRQIKALSQRFHISSSAFM
jgi:HTH-type transcriptional regulator/antitoxin HigA